MATGTACCPAPWRPPPFPACGLAGAFPHPEKIAAKKSINATRAALRKHNELLMPIYLLSWGVINVAGKGSNLTAFGGKSTQPWIAGREPVPAVPLLLESKSSHFDDAGRRNKLQI